MIRGRDRVVSGQPCLFLKGEGRRKERQNEHLPLPLVSARFCRHPLPSSLSLLHFLSYTLTSSSSRSLSHLHRQTASTAAVVRFAPSATPERTEQIKNKRTKEHYIPRTSRITHHEQTSPLSSPPLTTYSFLHPAVLVNRACYRSHRSTSQTSQNYPRLVVRSHREHINWESFLSVVLQPPPIYLSTSPFASSHPPGVTRERGSLPSLGLCLGPVRLSPTPSRHLYPPSTSRTPLTFELAVACVTDKTYTAHPHIYIHPHIINTANQRLGGLGTGIVPSLRPPSSVLSTSSHPISSCPS